jgi:hypothetical protein
MLAMMPAPFNDLAATAPGWKPGYRLKLKSQQLIYPTSEQNFRVVTFKYISFSTYVIE